MMTEKRLVIVSNRLPIQLKEKNGKVTLKESDGGLVSSLKSYLERATEHRAGHPGQGGRDSIRRQHRVRSAIRPERRAV